MQCETMQLAPRAESAKHGVFAGLRTIVGALIGQLSAEQSAQKRWAQDTLTTAT